MSGVFGRKLFGAAFLPLLSNQMIKQDPAECDGGAAADGADDLEKIFAEGGGMMDQHEMMELMMARQSKMKPKAFDQLMQNTAMFKQHEAMDGLNINMMLPFGQQFQLGGKWTLNTKMGAMFELTSSVNNSNGSPYQPQTEVKAANFVFGSDDSGAVMSNFGLPYGVTCQTQTQFNDKACKEYMNLVMLQKDFRDAAFGYRLQLAQGQGVHTMSWMQSISQNLQLGYQMTYIPMVGECNFGYAGLYSIGAKKDHQFTMAYSPMQQREPFIASYINRASQRLSLFCEFKGSPGGDKGSDFIGGFRMKFQEGQITGYMNSQCVAFATYAKSIEGNALRLEFNSKIDFKNDKSKPSFGLNMNVGMM